MSRPLFFATFKKNWVLLLIFCFVASIYTAEMIYMYDPESMATLMAVMEVFPPELLSAMGFSSAVADLTTYLASWLYGLIMIAFPMVYSIILGIRLVAKTVDSGSMVCLLATPNTREKIIVTKGLYALGSVAVLQMFAFGLSVLTAQSLFPGMLDLPAFFRLNVTAMLVNMTVMAITFFFSCLCNDAKYAMGFGAGVPIAFLLMKMLGDASDGAAALKRASIFGWYDPVALVTGTSALTVNLAYLGITASLFAAGVWIFNHKRLPI